MTQTTWVQSQLKRGHKITPLLALRKAGILRLAARVEELRRDGMRIKSKIITKHSKRFAEYSL